MYAEFEVNFTNSCNDNTWNKYDSLMQHFVKFWAIFYI